MNPLNIAVINMNSGVDQGQNLKAATSLVAAACGEGAEWVVLPEVFSYFGPYDRLKEVAEEEGGPCFQALSQLAASHRCVLFAGSVPEKPGVTDLALSPEDRQKCFNTTYIFGRSGELLGKYRKTHLFHLESLDGAPRYCESDGFLAGVDLFAKEIEGWKVSLLICYDLRFSEIFTALQTKHCADVIICPSAFTEATGSRHWELLLRARAVEYQCYVAAANQTGVHFGDKRTYGHSMVVDPWGKVLVDCGKEVGHKIASMDQNLIGEFRGKLPVLSNRRPELYSRWDHGE
jgi:nitrilase